MRFTLVAILSLLACASFPAGAADKALAVYVEATTPDQVGQQLVYAIREGLRRSTGMQFVSSSSDAFLAVAIVTLDPQGNGLSTVYSVVLTSRDGGNNRPHFDYENNLVGVCGASRVEYCANSIVASIDELSETYKRAVAEVLKRLEEQQKASTNTPK